MTSRLRTTVPWLATLLTVLLVASGITVGATPAIASGEPPVSEGTVTEASDPVDGDELAGDEVASDELAGGEAAGDEVAMPGAGLDQVVPDVSRNTAVPEMLAAPKLESAPAPRIAVSETTGLDPDGDTITVTGTNIKTGFVNTHVRPGVIEEAGVYAQIGYLDDVWRPSESAPAATRSSAASIWVKEAAPSDRYLAWSDNGDGTADFVWTTTIDYDTIVTAQRAGATLAVFTTGAGGVVQAANELSVPIAFDLPTVTVSKTTGLDSTGEVVTVTGSGFRPHAPETSGTRPPLAGKFGGTYIAFGKFADEWRPSEGTPRSSRTTSDVRWAVLAENLPDIASVPGGVVLEADGTFEVTLTVEKGFADEPAFGNYGIYTYPGGGVTFPRFETYTPISFTPLATDLSFSTAPVGQVTEGGLTTLTAKLASPIAGTVRFSAGGTTLGTVTPNAAGVATLVVSSLSVGAHALKAEFTPADPTSFTASSASLNFTVIAKPVVVAAGSFTWGVKQSFRDYVTSSIAKGVISTSGVRSAGGAFVFSQASGSTFNGTTGTSNYSGSVRFTGHGGILDLRLANPVVRVDSANSATLLLSVNGSTVPFATLALASGSKSTSNGAVTYSGIPATLTAQGASAFVNGDSQFYPAGTALDPVTFTIGSASSAGGGTQTVAAFVAVANGVPPTPPASSGISLQGASADTLLDGDEITITADGFESNEQGIKVVIYSDPVILATDATADARGIVTWTGRLPSGLTGEHTLTLQGSVDRGIVLTIAESTMMTTRMSGCVVSDATITWGFKEAFRSYVSSTIARGEWTVADGASYDIPNFGWSDGTGNYDPQNGEGLLAFTGAVTFTGHGGVLHTTISNPQLRFDDAETATLLLDVAGDTRDGVAVNQPGVEFATIDLPAAEIEADAGEHTITAAPAVLTADGSAAFGTYEPGTELDPITIAYSTDADCAAPVTAPTDDAEQPADSAAGPGWLLWVIIAAVLVALAAVVWALVARRRRQN